MNDPSKLFDFLHGPAVCLIILAGLMPASAATAQDEEEDENRVPITVTAVQSENIAMGVPAAGTVHSRNQAQVTAGLDARLRWVAEPGDFIEAGDVVARFDCRMLELQRDEQVAQADREHIRYESLGREIGRLEQARLATSALQLERVIADRELAGGEIRVINVRIRQSEELLNRCEARAPFPGIVTEQHRRAGEDVARGETLVAMTDIDHLEVRASVPIRHLPRMRKGLTASVQLDKVRLEGPIRTVVPAADPASQTFEVRIDLPAVAPTHLAAGQLVSVQLPLSSPLSLTVPRDSIVLRDDGAYVMRIDGENRARAIPVRVADASGERVAVDGELRPGDRVAVRGAEALDDGEAVTFPDS